MSNAELADRISAFLGRCTPFILPDRVIRDVLDSKYHATVERIAKETELEIPEELRQALESINYSLSWTQIDGIKEITFNRVLPPNPKREIKLKSGEALPTAEGHDLGARDGQDQRDIRRYNVRGQQ
jgi:hypothetical protein